MKKPKKTTAVPVTATKKKSEPIKSRERSEKRRSEAKDKPDKFKMSKQMSLAIEEAILARKDCVVLSITPFSYLLAKKIEITVSIMNDRSVFQPREHTEKRTYAVLAILQHAGQDKVKRAEILEKVGCSVYMIKSPEDVNYYLDKLN